MDPLNLLIWLCIVAVCVVLVALPITLVVIVRTLSTSHDEFAARRDAIKRDIERGSRLASWHPLGAGYQPIARSDGRTGTPAPPPRRP